MLVLLFIRLKQLAFLFFPLLIWYRIIQYCPSKLFANLKILQSSLPVEIVLIVSHIISTLNTVVSFWSSVVCLIGYNVYITLPRNVISDIFSFLYDECSYQIFKFKSYSIHAESIEIVGFLKKWMTHSNLNITYHVLEKNFPPP